MHEEFTILMSVSLDGEATAEENARLSTHLRTCSGCARIWERWRALDTTMAVAPSVAVPLTLVERVADRIDALDLQRRRARWFASGLLLAWVAAVVGALLFGASIAGWTRASSDDVMAAIAVLTGIGDYAGWFLRSAAVLIGELGAPRLAMFFGFLASMTCLAGIAWLWLLRHGQATTRPAMATSR